MFVLDALEILRHISRVPSRLHWSVIFADFLNISPTVLQLLPAEFPVRNSGEVTVSLYVTADTGAVIRIDVNTKTASAPRMRITKLCLSGGAYTYTGAGVPRQTPGHTYSYI